MILQHFYFISFLVIYLPLLNSARNRDLVTMKTGLADISPCSLGLQFYAVLNNTSHEDYFVELMSDECCIDSDKDIDCDSIEIIGETSEVVQGGSSKKFTLVAPILDPYERNGYCVIHVDSRPIDKRNNVMRDTIKIDFDTMLKTNHNIQKDMIKICEHKDEDPLNDCKPVNCDIYYNGKRPIYDENTKRCIKVPKCRSKKSEASDVYDPVANDLMIIDTIEDEDLDFIKSLSKDVNKIVFPENTVRTILEDAKSKKDVLDQKEEIKVRQKFFCDNLMQYMITKKCTLIILGSVILVQCFLICTMIFFLTKKTRSKTKKKVERKFFNYRQDVSVTTPLIATSNMDTETLFDYVSESSNIEKKIKCYKSCQKLKKNDGKFSMSDDILTKCLNRRDWKTKPKSDIAQLSNVPHLNVCNPEWKNVISDIKHATVVDNSNDVKTEEKATETVKEKKNEFKEDYGDSDSSEKFIKCHDYNFAQTIKIATEHNKKAPSISTEKGAQAYFSNDSIDDFLSERGMAFVTGETLSKYSFASNSTSNGQSSSSKTSKNRILKNVLSYFSKKSKKYNTSSDPGKTDKDLDLELIHMSKASMYSSSASDYKNIHGLKLTKDSRSTF